MRTPRSYLLLPHVAFHKMWQCHDHQHLLRAPETKRTYLDQLMRFKPQASQQGVRLFAFCVMDNHVHECGAIGDDHKPFCDWMRVAHGTFGRLFNLHHGRRGKVAIERPKTVVLEDDRAVLQVMLYLDHNPVEAGLVDDASAWPWSSHRFYAYGETNAWTKHLDLPDAYLALGDTPHERQRAYRDLYEAYKRNRQDRASERTEEAPEASASPSGPTARAAALDQPAWLPGDPERGPFFGSASWVRARSAQLGQWRRARRQEVRRRPPERRLTGGMVEETGPSVGCFP